MTDEIVVRGASILAENMQEVPRDMFGTNELKTLIERMSASLRETPHGVAIAANQIAIPWRIFVVRGFVMEGKERADEGADAAPDVPFINPVVTKLSRKKVLLEEACLSVPGFHGTIKRAERATVKAQDLAGKKFERGASGLLAQIFQHETDHLDGTLYVDKAEEVYEDQPEPEHDVEP